MTLLFGVPLVCAAAGGGEAPWHEQVGDGLGIGANALRGGSNPFFHTLSCYAKCIAPMHYLLELKIDMHSAQCELFLHLHAPFGVRLITRNIKLHMTHEMVYLILPLQNVAIQKIEQQNDCCIFVSKYNIFYQTSTQGTDLSKKGTKKKHISCLETEMGYRTMGHIVFLLTPLTPRALPPLPPLPLLRLCPLRPCLSTSHGSNGAPLPSPQQQP
jgi:hypothetical protein